MEPQPSEVAPEVDTLQYGAFGVRFAGRLIDWVVTIALGAVGGAIGGVICSILAATGVVGHDWLVRLKSAGMLGQFGWGLFAGLLYHAVSEGVGGTTVGKLILGYRVVSTELAPCSFGAAVIRSLAYFIDSFFFGVPAYTAMQQGGRQQRYGDRWAHTMVVKAGGLPAGARRSSGLVALGLICAMAAHAMAMSLSMVARVL